MAKKPLNALVLEDSEDDALLLVRELEKQGFALKWERAWTAAAMKSCLEARTWDIVLSDYSMQGFDAPTALRLLQTSGQDLPFIVISGTVGEEAAVAAMKNGGHDYLMKGNLKRLGEAIRREIRDVGVRSEHRLATDKIQHLDRVLRAIRRVNQLIVREKVPQQLIDRACRILVDNRGYKIAWIVVFGDALNPMLTASAGVGDEFLDLVEQLEAGRLPDCCDAALASPNVVFVTKPQSTCSDCPLRPVICDHGSFTVRLENSDEILGLLSVNCNTEFSGTEEEMSLLSEIAADVAFALRSIRLEEKRLQSERRKQLTAGILKVLAQPIMTDGNIPEILTMIREWGSFDDVDICLDERDLVPESMAAKVICGDLDPSLPFSTEGGSFWANNNMDVPADLIQSNHIPLAQTRSDDEACESVALIPLRSGDTASGLLQIRDRRGNRFTPEMIESFEEIGVSIAISLGRKRDKEALVRAAEHWEGTFDAITDIVSVISKDHEFLNINKAGIEAVNLPKHQILGRKCYELAHGTATPIMGCACTAALTTGQLETTELAENGRYYLVSAWPIVNDGGDISSFVHVMRDITDAKDAELALRSSEANFRKLFNETRDGILLADPDSKLFFMANETICRMTGYTNDEIVGLGVFDLHPEDQNEELVADFDESVRQKDRIRLGIPVRRKDGSVFFADISSTMIELSGTTYFMGSFRDITERLLSEKVQNEMQKQLLQSQKMESMGTLASGVAHEINNPIQIVSNYAELIRDDVDPDGPIAQNVDGILQASKRIATIVKNLLAFARQDKEHHALARVSDIVGSTISLFGKVLERDGIIIEVSITDDLPQIVCRSQQIQQVLMNLLTNARDALNTRYPNSHKDKVVRVLAGSLDRDDARWVRVTVENHGESIPTELMQRIFEPFFTTKSREKGTGLGLSVSHGIVKEHSGELTVETEDGGWTRFHMDLPADMERC